MEYKGRGGKEGIGLSETLWRVFGFIGMAGLGVAFALVCAFVVSEISDNIKMRRRKYALQHRFDKPPLAKCYCKDCSYRSNGLCDKFDRFVAEDFFCRHADPCDGEGESRWV